MQAMGCPASCMPPGARHLQGPFRVLCGVSDTPQLDTCTCTVHTEYTIHVCMHGKVLLSVQ